MFWRAAPSDQVKVGKQRGRKLPKNLIGCVAWINQNKWIKFERMQYLLNSNLEQLKLESGKFLGIKILWKYGVF
jgi:hypothetical protein